MSGDDLYSVGSSSVPDRPPPPTGPPKPVAAMTAASPAKEVTPLVVQPPAARLPAPVAKSGAAASRVVQEKVPASADPNVATRQTVEKMCEYIRAGALDELVQWWAECGVTRYGMGSRDPQALCWAMYWLVKHAIQFARDEPRLFQVGEGDALDMLIAPAVLVRMSQPKEDCDGFTMLVCALLQCVGVRTVIVTVAADPQDPSRWSHVFPMALTPQPIPLDASHGSGPGWIVPAAHTFRWQAWDCDGSPCDVKRPRRQGLHGWVPSGHGFGGLGQDVLDEYITDTGDTSGGSSVQLTGPGVTDTGSPYFPVTTYSPNTPTPASSSSFNWTSFLQNLTNQAAGVAKVAEVNASATNASLALSGAFSSLLPIIAVVVVGGFLISSMGKK